MLALQQVGVLGLLLPAVGCAGSPSSMPGDSSTGSDPVAASVDGSGDSSTGGAGDEDTAGESEESGAPAECGNGVVEPGEHCDRAPGDCPADCRYPEGTEIWFRSLGTGTKAFYAPGALTTDRALAQDPTQVYAARLQLDPSGDPIVALHALAKIDGEPAWDYVVENPGGPVQCMDCTPTIPSVTSLVQVQGLVCVGGQVRGESGPQGLVACVDATGAESLRYVLPESEWGESSVGALAVSESGGLVAAVWSDAGEQPNALLALALDGTVTDVLELDLDSGERASDLVTSANGHLVLSTRARVQSRAQLATVGWNVMIESARLGHVVSRPGSILAVGTQTGASEALIMTARAFDPGTGADVPLTGDLGDSPVRYVSDVAVAPDGRAFAAVTSEDGDTASVVAIELDGSSEIIWSGSGESGGVRVDGDGFVTILGDDLGPYESWVRRIAIALG